MSAAHPVFASAEPEDNSHLQVWQLLVPQVRLELTRLSALASKTSVATITPPGQNLERVARIELANNPWQGFRLPLHHTRINLLIIIYGGGLAESNSNRVSSPSVFKTVLGPA